MIFCPDCGNRNVQQHSEGATGDYYNCWRCQTVFQVINLFDVSDNDYEEDYDDDFFINYDEEYE